jgi:hypothetical protein
MLEFVNILIWGSWMFSCIVKQNRIIKTSLHRRRSHFSSPSPSCPRQLAQNTPRVPSADDATGAPDKSVVWGQLFPLIPGISVLNVCAKYFARPVLVQTYFK